MTAITDFLTRYAWARPIIGAVFGVIGTVIYFLVAQYWLTPDRRHTFAGRQNFSRRVPMVDEDMFVLPRGASYRRSKATYSHAWSLRAQSCWFDFTPPQPCIITTAGDGPDPSAR